MLNLQFADPFLNPLGHVAAKIAILPGISIQAFNRLSLFGKIKRFSNYDLGGFFEFQTAMRRH